MMTKNPSSHPERPPFQIVIASTNVHKIREFKAMFKHLANLDFLSLCDFPEYVPTEEVGQTFEEIAADKALRAAKELNQWVLADDSGLVVPALTGAPGVRSARYAGSHATDLENRKKLISEMAHLMEEDRSAFYECCIALASPEGVQKQARGTCEGTLLLQERGSGGFGYDPLFVKHGYSKTFSELGESVKNRISHRRKAVDRLLSTLEML